jgi:septal ring factor EnvC (AmiA/AmiB activator)
VIDTLLAGGGLAGLLTAIAYAYRQIMASRREDDAIPAAASAAAVTDAQATNAMLLAALKSERQEVQQLSREVGELRVANTELYAQLRQQRSEYEAELSALRGQLTEVSERLGVLQSRLSTDLP